MCEHQIEMFTDQCCLTRGDRRGVVVKFKEPLKPKAKIPALHFDPVVQIKVG
jgi:hypothetical protein